jgi:hypothetical protein
MVHRPATDAPICVRLTRLVADVLRSFSGAA